MDQILASPSAFPTLKQVDLHLLNFHDNGPLLRLNELIDGIRGQMPRLLGRGMLSVAGEPIVGVSSHRLTLRAYSNMHISDPLYRAFNR